MSATPSWLEDALSALKEAGPERLPPEKLLEIRSVLDGLRLSAVREAATSLSLAPLFESLNSPERSEVDAASECLEVLLNSQAPGEVVRKYEAELAKCLVHPDPHVKHTALTQLCRLEGEEDMEAFLTRRPAFLGEILQLMREEDLATARSAVQLLTKIGETEFGLNCLLSGDTESFVQDLNSSGAIYSLRVYQVIVEIGCKSEEKLSRMESAGLLRGLGDKVTSDDILGKMAMVEELSKLVATPHGYRFLSRQNCIHILAQELIEAPKSPVESLITPGLLKFFGHACQKHAVEIHRDYSQVVDTVLSLVYSDNLTIATTAIEAVGFICSSSQGKLLLNQTGDAGMIKLARRIENLINKGQVEWKHRILYALANFLNVHENDLDKEEIVRLTQKWFGYMGEGPGSGLSLLFALSKNPFPEVKLAAFHVILKLSRLQWGQLEISKFPGALKYLLDRGTESDMQALLAKFEIVSALADSATSADVFNEEDYQSIVEYKNLGATHAPPKLCVAVEGAE